MVGVLSNFNEPVITKGVAEVSRFTVSEEQARMFNMRVLLHYGHGFERIEAGDYVRLHVGNVLMMSDTPFERRTNEEFIRNAHGEVMIAGLGIGLLLENLKPLVAEGKVTRIVVYEKYQDVIDLVGNRYAGMPLEIRCADIMEYIPPKREKYDTLYFDIWPHACADNLKDVAILHNRWKFHKRPGGWMDSWLCKFLRKR